MKLAILILVIILILIILLFTVALRIKVVLDTYKSNLNMSFLWLHSFLKALVTIEYSKPMLTMYFLNKKLFKRKLKSGSGAGKFSGFDLIKMANPKHVHVNTNYGFRDPYNTGITCGAISMASQLINIDSINQNPDFTAAEDYIHIDASAKVNLGSTIIKLFKYKANHK
jgi:hypothetical protein